MLNSFSYSSLSLSLAVNYAKNYLPDSGVGRARATKLLRMMSREKVGKRKGKTTQQLSFSTFACIQYPEDDYDLALHFSILELLGDIQCDGHLSRRVVLCITAFNWQQQHKPGMLCIQI